MEWVDVFTRYEFKEIVLEGLRYCRRETGLVIYAWCLMTNHIHLTISAEKADLSAVLCDFKKFTSKQLIGAIKNNQLESRKKWMMNIFEKPPMFDNSKCRYEFRSRDNHPKELYSRRFIDRKLDYIHNNPVETGIIDKAEEYRYRSARDYYCGKREELLEIDWL